MILRTIIFLAINFGALALGSYLMNGGTTGEWYAALNKAPWTPPGWVFGAAWTIIMIAFSIFMALAWKKVRDQQKLKSLFLIQFVLNIAWNPVFFDLHEVLIALIIISLLTIVVTLMMEGFKKEMKQTTWLVAPYLVWLLIAVSLNAYALVMN